MSDDPKNQMPAWALPALAWLVSFYFLLGFCSNVGFPPDRKLLIGDGLYVFLWLFFLFLPFFTKIKIGSVLELERQVEHAKKELADFKTEVRSTLSVLSTNVNTIGGMTNQVTVNLPGLAELREARQQLDARTPPEAKESAQQVEERILLQSEDRTLALVKTRIDIERLLRQRLGRTTSASTRSSDPVRFLSVNRLFELFLSQNEQYDYLQKSFRYVIEICNAAIHAQRVSPEQADEALALGAQVVAALLEKSNEAQPPLASDGGPSADGPPPMAPQR